ncbi:AEC family transporter [Pseudoalteromonas fenneropenaei]|uniref:AEC family transporter n=1 Tax=Pseudoalteromonas fenneropenaei TaxID=1737459 RepID=A0ABV7CK14_9GAMM
MIALTTLFPLAALVLVGYIAARYSWISQPQLDGVRHFIFNLVMPVFLFANMLNADLATQFNLPSMLAFYLPVLGWFLLSYLNMRRRGRATNQAASIALGTTYSNTVLVALPVILFAFGTDAGAMVFMIITFHSALLFALTFFLAQSQQQSRRMLVNNLLYNPIVASISLGILANVLLPPLPELVGKTLQLFGQPALPGALFVLGASLNQYKVGSTWRMALMLSAVKLVILPFSVYSLGHWVFNLTQLQLTVVTLMSAAPLGVNAYLVARQLNSEQATIASTVVLSTLLSGLTLSAWLVFFTQVG